MSDVWLVHRHAVDCAVVWRVLLSLFFGEASTKQDRFLATPRFAIAHAWKERQQGIRTATFSARRGTLVALTARSWPPCQSAHAPLHLLLSTSISGIATPATGGSPY